MRLACLLLLAAFGASAAAADTPPPPASKPAATQANTGKPADLDRIICHTDDQTGTRLPGHKVCHSKREWEDLATLTRQNLDSNSTHQQGLDQH